MAKRNLRIVKRSRNIPVLGVCEHCNAQFPADAHRLGDVANAQASIQEQFNAHNCGKVEESNHAAARSGKETAGNH